MDKEQEFFESFSIKAIVENSEKASLFLESLCQSYQDFGAHLTKGNPSQNHKYQSYHIHVKNISKPVLDTLYQKISKHPLVKWTL